MSLEYEPSSEPLHIGSGHWAFLPEQGADSLGSPPVFRVEGLGFRNNGLGFGFGEIYHHHLLLP